MTTITFTDHQLRLRISLHLRNHRREQRLTRKEFADQLGVAAPTLQAWETSDHLPDLPNFVRICHLTQTSPETLLACQPDSTS